MDESGGYTVRAGAIAGAVSPYLFLLAAIAISWIENDFMGQLGWEVWPSGLALGPYGWLQILNFVTLGALLLIFAVAVAAVPAQNRWVKLAPALLTIAAVGPLMLAFETDPPHQDATWHGVVHGAAYFTWLVSIAISYPLIWWRLRSSSTWSTAPRWPSVFSLLLFPPVYLLPDNESGGNYLFFAAVLTPLAANRDSHGRGRGVDSSRSARVTSLSKQPAR